MRKFTSLILILSAMLLCVSAMAQRHFTHPGISYTKADIDRMKAMIAAKQEPFYSSYQRFANSRYTTYRDIARPLPKASNGEPVVWENRQLWFGEFGNVAFNNALMWLLTDDAYYAERARTVLNRYNKVRSTIRWGTNCLDNGAATPLIEAAELLRDYSGWTKAEQDSFKMFLLSPGYSTTTDYYKQYENTDTITNRCTIYWNIFQGDDGRHGNQGLYGMRCLMAMGIYLDNDTIYQRALRKVLSQPHLSYDLPYPSGGRWSTQQPSSKMPDYCLGWDMNPHAGHLIRYDTIDYGSDDELKYWIYENGQCQESARDQGHVMDGMGNMTDIAQVAWNQGDDIFTAYDDRLLKGINYSVKYNYGWLNNVCYDEKYWQGEELFEPTVENGLFEQRLSRNHAFLSLKINPFNDNSYTWTRGKHLYNPEKMLMAYGTRLGRSADDLLWIDRACIMNKDSLDAVRASSDYESSYDAQGGNDMLTHRTAWMAGDGGTFQDKQHVSGLPEMPGSISAVDYDFFNTEVSGKGRTWFTDTERTDELYREEGGLPVAEGDGGYVLTNLGDSAWANYTFTLAESGTYNIKVRARVRQAGVSMGVAVDNSRMTTAALSEGDDYQEYSIGTLKLEAGARVLRLYGMGMGSAVEVSKVILEKVTDDVTMPVDYVWNSRDYKPVSGEGSFLTDQSDTQLYSTSYSSTTQAVFTMAASDMNYRVQKEQNYLVMRGTNLDHAVLKSATYKLTDDADDRSKSLNSGQSNIYKVKDSENRDVLVWKVDSAVSKRIKALLNECYASANSSYILRKLSLLVYGVTTALPVTIDDFSFYTPEQMEAMNYPTPTGIDGITIEGNGKASDAIYDLQGRRVDKPLQPGVYIQGNKKIIVP
jgi:hypothetical protein